MLENMEYTTKNMELPRINLDIRNLYVIDIDNEWFQTRKGNIILRTLYDSEILELICTNIVRIKYNLFLQVV